MEQKHPHSIMIDALGRQAVKKTYDLSRQNLSAWYKRGVPHRRRHAFAKLCQMNGVHVPLDFYD